MSVPTCASPTRITITDHEGRERSALLDAGNTGPIRIGRASENDIQIISPYISRLHGEIWPHGDGVVYKDLSSTSGSYFHGNRIDRQPLESGDTIQLGSPSGLCLTILEEERDEDTERPGRTNTEVLRVVDVGASQYASGAGLAAQGKSPKSSPRGASAHTEERLRALIALTNSLISIQESGQLADALLREVLGLLQVDRGMVLLDNEGKLEPIAWRVRGEQADMSRSGRIPILNLEDELAGEFDEELPAIETPKAPFRPIKTVTERVLRECVGLLSLDAGNDERLETSKSLVLQAVRAIMAVPIVSSKKVYGVIYLDTQRPLTRDDEDSLDWLVAIGQQAGSIMESLSLAEEQRLLSESMMRGLAASIDARDGLTAGHSARVAHYSLGTARALGLDADEQYRIYHAGLLHDYGKIGVDDAVLRKPAALTPEEYEHIKQHARFTFDILSKISFPKKLRDLPLMAASHHERWDGKGYPWQLSGDDIPIAGRIIAIADVYDSLTRKRHYRDPMPVEEVLDYLAEGSGTRFDPVILDAFLQYQRDSLAEKEERWRLKRARAAAQGSEEPTLHNRGETTHPGKWAPAEDMGGATPSDDSDDVDTVPRDG
jgi:HD-GYP domain-containing protein (c-di-GMP phosphodiesterase class II)